MTVFLPERPGMLAWSQKNTKNEFWSKSNYIVWQRHLLLSNFATVSK